LLLRQAPQTRANTGPSLESVQDDRLNEGGTKQWASSTLVRRYKANVPLSFHAILRSSRQTNEPVILSPGSFGAKDLHWLLHLFLHCFLLCFFAKRSTEKQMQVLHWKAFRMTG
jgi:hypothetical protein